MIGKCHFLVRVFVVPLLCAWLFNISNANASASWQPANHQLFQGYSVDFTPVIDPGPASNVFWASQYSMPGNVAAYFGMQTPRSGGKGTILWSVWGATDFRSDGSPGTRCFPFQEGSPGKKCDVRVDWKVGYTYRFKLQYLGDNWYRNTVTELQTGRQINMGSIRAAKPGITSGVNWIEYFDWSNRSFNWDGAPNASIRWSNLILNTGEKIAFEPNLSETERFSLSPDKRTITIETYAGRSQQLPLVNLGTHRCMGLSSGTLAQVECPSSLDATPPDRNSTWTFTQAKNGSASQIHAYNACLMADAVGGSVYVSSPCGSQSTSPGIESSWINNLEGDGTLHPAAAVNKCLTFASGRFSVAPCTGSTNQDWAQIDDYSKAYWKLEDTAVPSSDKLLFTAELSRPASQESRTSINVVFKEGLLDVMPGKLRVTWPGGPANWQSIPVYNGYVSLPAGVKTLYIAADIPKQRCISKKLTGRLSLQEFARGDFKAMPRPWTANGTIERSTIDASCPLWGQ